MVESREPTHLFDLMTGAIKQIDPNKIFPKRGKIVPTDKIVFSIEELIQTL